MGDEEEWAKLPLAEQFTHKNWKARKLGYEAAAKGFTTAQPSDPIVRDFVLDSNLWKGAVGDANVAAQQEALSAYNAFLDIAGTEGARKTRSSTITPIVEKGLTGRPAAKQAALESLLLLIELDKADPVIEEILPFISHKQPKLIAAMLSALTSIVHAYGCKIVEPKAVVKILPKAFGHADKNVRTEGQNLSVELYRWLREAMKPLFWSELKPVQQTDLEKLFEPVQSEPPAKQERLLRSQQAAREEAAAAAPEAGEAYEEEEAEIDLEPEFLAVDVTSKIPKDLGERLGSTKWKDRKEVLDEVFAAVNVPAIQEGPFDEIVRGCAKGMKDANIMVVVVSANVIEALAKGLRKAFTKYRSTVLAAMLERFKEKKASVTDAIGAACDAVFLSTNLGEVQADSLEALKSKNPQVKDNTAKFLIRCFKTTKEPPSLEQTKEYAEASKKLLSESAAPLRDAGAEILGTMWKIMGDRNMLAHMDGVDEIRKTKIKEFCDAAEVRAKWKPKAAPAPKAAAPAGRKPPPSAKKPAPSRRPAPAPASPSPVEDDPPPAPRSVARPVSKPPGSLRPPTGLKPPSGLQKPAAGLKTPSNTLMSPKRQGMVLDDGPTSVAPRTPVAANRGLAGRPLGKPAAPTTPPPAAREPPPTPSFSSVDRQELIDLREEVDLVRQHASDLRQDKMRLTSQIHELQNQNAQLIEDHTRDVLQIKAKETQLVRARSDAENAEERANTLSREIERLKREMSRLGRQNADRDSPVDHNHQMNSGGYRPAYSSHRSYNTQSMYGADSFNTISEDGEANNQSSRPMSVGSSGRATPNTDGQNGLARSSSLNKNPNEGVESWRRAAEVTQNLKARIEMMKARQNIGRGQ
ncbi:hypothetical protein AMS68_004720 [Peltaster fructicola]|uniref:TOG domain-containing protein n=1 Tax=Peltaster fructicola TaxID=286661 RepID=A0A6H0XWS6_9PEZI|nr:hypothetical protein AMS68_004720 [Peltaster fructicola]